LQIFDLTHKTLPMTALIISLALGLPAFADSALDEYIESLLSRSTPAPISESSMAPSVFSDETHILLRTTQDAARVCRNHFQGIFYWWTCKEDLTSVAIPRAVFQAAVSLSESINYDVVDDLLKAAANRHVDDEVFTRFSIRMDNRSWPDLVELVANLRFTPELMQFCLSGTDEGLLTCLKELREGGHLGAM
jgi:hypothetical protein